MKLYYSFGACSMAPHIVALEAGHTIDLEKVDISKKTTADGGDYRKINPKGYVPTLVLDDGQVLTEVAVICQYLADQRPESGLMPKFGTIERYHQLEALNFAATEIHKQLGALYNPKMTPEMKTVQMGTIEQRFDTLENMLEGKAYIMGDKFTAADAYLFTVLNWTNVLKIDLTKWRNIKAYITRITGRPKVREAMKAEGMIQ